MKKSMEKIFEGMFLKSIKDKESLKSVDDKYNYYFDHIFNLKKYQFNHLPKSFSEMTDIYIKYIQECKKKK